MQLATDRNDGNFRLGPVWNHIVLRFLPHLWNVFRVKRKQSCGNWREMRRRAHFTGVIKRRHILSKTSILCHESRSGILVKLRLPSECPSSPYDKATTKQKSNTVKFPHHSPYTLPHFCFSPPPLPSLPQSKSLFCKTWSDEKIIMHAKETTWKLLYKTSKFLRNIGTFEEPG